MENPRASSTDNVEYFYSVLRDTARKDFTLKEVRCCISITVSKSSQQCRFSLDGESNPRLCKEDRSGLTILLLSEYSRPFLHGRDARFQQ